MGYDRREQRINLPEHKKFMLSQTKHALEEFDNQHDFERMAADILNALGYQDVEPMAPGGGSDKGQDIKFKDGDSSGVALVTTDKKIEGKFSQDLAKQSNGEGVIALFCNVNLTPAMKITFSKAALAKGYRLEPFDLERLRSLLDASLKEIRRRYLHIDDEVAVRLRSEVHRLLRFPEATPDSANVPTMIEQMLIDKAPRRLFELLMQFEEKDISEVPGIGDALQKHLTEYYRFRQEALRVERILISQIGQKVAVRFPHGWQIYLRYVLLRFGGLSKDQIVSGGSFLNYDITWEDAERVFTELAGDAAVFSEISNLYALHTRLGLGIAKFRP
jgi:hypothetical protein